MLQFLRELHFIEAFRQSTRKSTLLRLQFLRELHFIEASIHPSPSIQHHFVAVPSGAALH